MKEDQIKDTENPIRQLNKNIDLIVNIIALTFALFYLYTCAFGLISMELHRGGYLLFSLLLCFLLYPARKGQNKNKDSVPLIDWILWILTIVAIGYWIINYPTYAYRIGNPTTMDILMGIILIGLSLEVARRVLGYILPILAIIFLLYAYFGPFVPGILGHYGFKIARIVEYSAVGMGGIYGVVVNTYATYIFPFIIFASFFQASGGGSAIEEISRAVAGGTRGGPAKIAVISSGLIGSVTGSSAANAVITGSYTIPLMKRLGYKSHIAAGVEAAASTGGQFMPPIMGAAAFLIAAFTETPYMDIVKISIIPAILYFFGVGMMVHFIAVREGIKGLPKEQIPNLTATLYKKGYLLLPIVMVFVFLIRGYSVQMSAFFAIFSTIILSYFQTDTRMSFWKIINALISGAKNSLIIGSTAGVIGIMIAIINMTGLGIKFSSLIISLSKGILPLTIFFVAITSYIMGMGVTITASYIIISVLAAPALTELGVPLLTSHLVVFWLCQTGGVTPPVALVAFAASSIARCNPHRAGFAAVKLASPLFIMPFLFVYTPILFNGPLLEVMETVISAMIGMIAFAGMMQGCWIKKTNILERILLGFAAFCLFTPNIISDLVGVLLLIVVTMINKDKSKVEV